MVGCAGTGVGREVQVGHGTGMTGGTGAGREGVVQVQVGEVSWYMCS